ncbi:unnamed protein product, partial [Notodromas monacha]
QVIQRIGTAYDDLVQPAELSFKFADFYQPPLNMECHFSPHATLLLVGPDDAGKLNFAIESFLTEESVAREVRKVCTQRKWIEKGRPRFNSREA